MNKIFLAIMMLLATMAFLPRMVGATDFTADITNYAVISNPDTQESPRALLMFNLPEDFTGKSIRSAKLFIPVSFTFADSDFANLSIWPIGTTWSADNVSWTNPWNQAGGDVADSSYVLFPTDNRSARVLEIDVSGIATAWAQGWYPNHGLMLMLLQDFTQNFQIESIGDWDNGVVARIEISYEE